MLGHSSFSAWYRKYPAMFGVSLNGYSLNSFDSRSLVCKYMLARWRQMKTCRAWWSWLHYYCCRVLLVHVLVLWRDWTQSLCQTALTKLCSRISRWHDDQCQLGKPSDYNNYILRGYLDGTLEGQGRSHDDPLASDPLSVADSPKKVHLFCSIICEQ